MGKIKTKIVKRTAQGISSKGIQFSPKFEENKRILGNNTMPSKKIRNQIAGYLVRLERNKQTK